MAIKTICPCEQDTKTFYQSNNLFNGKCAEKILIKQSANPFSLLIIALADILSPFEKKRLGNIDD